MDQPNLAQILRYPVKGLSAETLTAVALEPGRGLPHDRRFAFARGTARFDGAPGWLPRSNFLNLSRDEKLAALDTEFDAATGTLTIRRDGRQVSRGQITTPTGRLIVQQFMAAYMSGAAGGAPRLVEAASGAFTDSREPWIAILNLASVQDLEQRVAKAPVDPRRFRANLVVVDLPPWAEFGWVGRELQIGGARLRVTERIERCAATNVAPGLGTRDLNLPQALQRGYGHCDMGVYAEVVEGGEIRLGDQITVA
ncbi:MAG TPA: MOSC domain-containing protein [Alphaproteobacteria bacterium]|nr:MOSC domain-containing protein [Alphaproteobacteria bacterium]